MSKTRFNRYRNLATLGQLGYWLAPGTVGTLAAVPFVGLARAYISSDLGYLGLCLVLLLTANWILQQAYRHGCFAVTDAPEIIIDEWVGFFWAALLVPPAVLSSAGISTINLLSWGKYWALLVLLFRCFDILKPWPIHLLERIPSSWGVLLDDVGAALLTNLLVWLSYSWL